MEHTKKRVLLLDTGREWGGGTNSMLALLERIDRQSYSFTCCFYYNYHGTGVTDIKAALQALDIPLITLAQRPIPRWAKMSKELLRLLLFFHRGGRQRATHFIDMLWRIAPNARKIHALLQQGGYDILYMNNQPITNIEGYLAAATLPDVAVIQHCRIEPHITRSVAKTVNRVANAIIGVSAGVQRKLVHSGIDAKRCFVVTNAIDTQQTLPTRQQMRAQANIPENCFVFGTISSLIKRKSVDHILRALARWRQAQPQAQWKMIILGSGPEEQRLNTLAQTLALSHHVDFIGFRSDVFTYLAQFDVFILASKSEGFPRVILEAMLMGVPVVGSRVIGTQDLIRHGETGLLFDYGNVNQLYQQLDSLWQHAAQRRQLAEHALQEVRQQHTIEHYVASVEQILAGHTKPV